MSSTLRPVFAASLLVVVPLATSSCTREARSERKIESANKRMAAGDFAGAEIDFKSALDLQPGNARALKSLGLLWVKQGQSLEAAQLLTGALDKFPENDEVALGLAAALQDLTYFDDSRRHVLKVLDRSPDNEEALMLLADLAFTEENRQEVEKRIQQSGAAEKPAVLLASAMVLLRQNLIESGTDLLERILENDPENVRANALMAAVLRSRSQPEAALEWASKASKLAGPRSPEIRAHATLLMELKRPEEAVTLLSAATKEAPNYLPNWRMLALIASSEGKPEEAAAHLSKVLDRSPLDLEAGLLQSQLWLEGGSPDKAAGLLERLAQAYPGRPVVEFPLAKAYLASGEENKAIGALDRVLDLVPGAPDPVLLRTRLFLKEGNAAEAIRSLEPLVRADPANKPAQDLLVTAYNAADRTADAVGLLQQQVGSSTDDPMPLVKLGILLAKEKKDEEAREAFTKALALDPENMAATAQLVGLEERAGNRDAAMKRIDDYLSRHPESVEALVLKARIHHVRKEPEPARELGSKALTLDPGSRSAAALMVSLHLEAGRTEEAVRTLTDFLATSTASEPEARMQLGSLLLQLGKNEEAIANFEKLTTLEPNFAPAHNNLAYLHSEVLVDLDKAEASARKARSLSPRDPAVADTAGWIESLRGNHADALPLLDEAVAGMPESTSALYHRGITHYKLGHLDLATEDLQKAVALGGPFPEKKAAEERLASLASGAGDLATLEQRAEKSPDDVALQLQLAAAYEKADRHEDAIAAFDQALKANPDLLAAHLGKSRIYARELDDPAKALETAKLARRASPTSTAAAGALGAAHYLNGNYEAAYGLLKDATADTAADPQWIEDFARTAYSMGRVDEARSAMERLPEAVSKEFLTLTAPDAAGQAEAIALAERTLQARPDDVPALMVMAATPAAEAGSADIYRKILEARPSFDPARKALAMKLLGDPAHLDEVESLVKEARIRSTNDTALTGMLGIVSFRKGRFDYAIQLLKEVARSRELAPREQFALGMAQAETGAAEEARENLNPTVLSKLTAAENAEAKAALERLATKSD